MAFAPRGRRTHGRKRNARRRIRMTGGAGLLFLDSDKNIEPRTDHSFLVTQNTDANWSSMYDPVNIGSPCGLTVLEIAKLVLGLPRSSRQIATSSFAYR